MKNKKEGLIDLKTYPFLLALDQIRAYSKEKSIFLNRSAADALLVAKKYLPKEHNFKIKDGFRSLAVQKKIVEIHEKQFKKDYPDKWLELVNKYTGGRPELKLKKISFMNHRSGYAVDLTITKNGREINMGGVKLNKKDGLNYYEDRRELNREETNIRNNRRLLKKVMEKAGFQSHPAEWWHWGYIL